MTYFKTVVDWMNAEIVYAGTCDYSAARALEPGTVIGYSRVSQQLSQAQAEERMNTLREKIGMNERTLKAVVVK